MAEGAQEPASQPGEAHEGAGKRECSPEEIGGGSGVGHSDFEAGVLGKFLSPPRRQQAVEHVRQVSGVSERRACRVLGQSRSTQRGRALPQRDEPRPEFTARMVWQSLEQVGRMAALPHPLC